MIKDERVNISNDIIKIINYFNEINNSKPNPEIFLKVADKLKCSPNKCIVLEDSEAGIISASKAEMLSIMISDVKEPSKEIEEIIFRNMNNLLDVKLFLERVVNNL